MNTAPYITPSSVEDLDLILELEQRKENKTWIFPYTHERHRQVIHSDTEMHFTLKSEIHNLLGYVILAMTNKEDQSIELRRIVIKAKGIGLGRACLQWMKNYCFLELKAHRVWLDVFLENHRALKLYLSEGFVREGVKRECISGDGIKRSLYILSILHHEYSFLNVLTKTIHIEFRPTKQ